MARAGAPTSELFTTEARRARRREGMGVWMGAGWAGARGGRVGHGWFLYPWAAQPFGARFGRLDEVGNGLWSAPGAEKKS